MKLIVIYGPPGVGKLTVARVLARRTGYKLFHNHLTIELLCSLFEWGSPMYRRFSDRYRFELFAAAARSGVKGVIFTYVYAVEEDDAAIRKLIRRMKAVRTKVLFVQLQCDQKVLEQRLTGHDRLRYTKIRHVKNLRSLMKRYDLTGTAPFPNTITIDNTNLSPARVATMIRKHWKL